MNSIKKALDKIFIEGLSAMAQGLFATLIIGTIIQQIGNLIPGQLGKGGSFFNRSRNRSSACLSL